LPAKTRRALFYKATMAELPPALPRSLRVKLAKTQAKIQAILTTPTDLVLDDKTKMDRVPWALQRELEQLQDHVRTVIMNDLDPQNLNGDAHRQWQRDRVFA
jgi:hypothetical protein